MCHSEQVEASQHCAVHWCALWKERKGRPHADHGVRQFRYGQVSGGTSKHSTSSILLDVSYGLVYLHERNPPIVHRDLTARNILVTDKSQAKIADLGVAKVVDIRAQASVDHTQNPGQMFYMPPETKKEGASCTPKLDIFSFGHLTLYTVNQEFPQVYDITRTVTSDMQKQGVVERAKRKKAIDQVGKDHCLYETVVNCLSDEPENRPSTLALNADLIDLSRRNSNQADDLQTVVELNDVVQSQKVYIAELETARNNALNEVSCQ